jgi:PAS domain S-box-containing protein
MTTEDPRRNFTARKAAEAALAASEARWRTLVTQAPVVILLLEPDGMVITANRTVSGRAVEEVIGRKAYEFLPEAHWGAAERIRREVVGTGMPQRMEYPLDAPDGRRLWIDAQLAPVLDGGAVRSLILVLTDVTPLRESEARWRSLVTQAPAVISQIARDGSVLFINRPLAGRTVEEMIGRPVLDLVGGEAAAIGRAKLAEAFETGERVRFDLSLPTPDGDRVHAQGILAPVVIGGKVQSVISVVTDTTALVRAEAERRALEAKMQQAQKLESLGILAGGIAHDFNNLLTAVIGNADLALGELPPASAARESVEQIQKAALHAAELTRQMLAYAGRGRLSVQRLSIAEVVRDMSQLLGASVSKRHALIFDFAADLPAVEADPAQVRQIVMNLVINASEACGEREGAITVGTAMLPPGVDVAGDVAIGELGPGAHVVVEVADSGAGMDAADLPRIFDPFFSTKFAGRGLGLAAVLGVVRRHGGALRVRSRPGAGSTFTVLLPALEGAGAPPPLGPGSEPPSDWRGAGTLLLVDDEEQVRRTASRMLQAMGFDVVVAGDGVEALARLAEGGGRIRAVLLDLTMPRMDGEETLRSIRATSPGLPVVLCSGYDVLEREGRFADLEFSGFIQKPFRLAELQRSLRRALEA